MTPRVRDLTIAAVAIFIALTVAVTLIVFISPPDIPMGTATAYATFIGGPLVAAWQVFKWARSGGSGDSGTG